MATSGSSRDVKMTLSVETLGAEDIKKLQSDVANLAKQGGEAAPEFQRLADEIARLGQQAAALQAFQQLATETGTLAAQQEKAAASAGQMGDELKRLEAVTKAAAAAQADTAQKLKEAEVAVRNSNDAIGRLTAQTAAAKKADDSYAETLERMKLARLDQRKAVEQQKEALLAAKAVTDAAEEAEAKLAHAYKQTAQAADATNQALRNHVADVAKAANAAEELGLSTHDVAAAQAELVQGLNKAGTAARTLETDVARLAARQKELDDIRAFEKQADAARRLVIASEYVGVFDEALRKLAATEKEEQEKKLDEKWQRDAFAMVEAAHAAQKLTQEAERLEEAQRKIAVQAAFEKMAEDARKLVQAGAYVELWREELEKAERQAQETAAAGKKINDAFNSLGVRGVQELQAEITKVRTAMETVRASAVTTGTTVSGAFAAGEAKVAALQREIREVSGTLTTADKAAKLFSNSLGQIAAGNVIADGVGYLVNKVKELGRAFLESIVQGDQMRRGLNAIYRDASVTAQQIEFLRKSSSASGVAFGSLSGEFVKFSASMKSANIPLAQSNELFKAVTAASASLGLGAEATAGSLNALGQMAAKGVVSMEELRQQLGDRLPGALGLSAKGLGITEAQLIKLVESGQLATRDFVGPLTEALKSLAGETDGLVPTWERFKGAMSQAAQNAGDSGWLAVLTGALKVLGGALGVVVLAILRLTEGIGALLKTGGILAAAVTTWTAPWSAIGEVWGEANKRQTDLENSFKAMLFGADSATGGIDRHSAAMTSNTAEVVRAISANESLNAVQKLTALSTALAADATLDASAKHVQFGVAVAELMKLQEAQTEAFGKSAKAAKEAGDTLVRLATLTGEVAEIQKAQAAADEMTVAALEKVAASRLAELEILVQSRTEMDEYQKVKGLSAEAIKVEREALEKKILVAKAEVAVTEQAAAASRAERFQRQLSAETYADNSKKVEQYRNELEEYVRQLAAVEEGVRRGVLTEKDAMEARLAVTRATVLLTDAERDRTRNQEMLTRAIAAENVLEQANLGLQMAKLKAAESKAIADGNEFALRKSLIAQKELEIKMMTLKLAGQIAEQNATIAGLKLKQAELELGDPLYAQKMAAVDLSIKAAEAKILEAKAAGENVAAMERELQALKLGTDARTAQNTAITGGAAAYTQNTEAVKKHEEAMDRLMMKYTLSADYSERQIALLEREAAAHEKAIAAENKRLNRDSQGYSVDPTTGQRVNMQIDNQRSVYENAKSQGLTEQQALAIMKRFMTDQGEKTGWSDGGLQGAMLGETWGTAIQKAINEQVLKNAANAGAPASPTASPAGPLMPNPSPATKTVTVDIRTERGSNRVNVASQADAQALTAVLRQLESAKGTAA